MNQTSTPRRLLRRRRARLGAHADAVVGVGSVHKAVAFCVKLVPAGSDASRLASAAADALERAAAARDSALGATDDAGLNLISCD